MLMHRSTRRFFYIIYVVTFVHVSPFSASAEPSCTEGVAKLVSLQGTVEVRRVGEADWQTVGLEDTFCFGDTIRVKEDSRAAVQLQNDALLRLDQSTTLTFSHIENQSTYIIDLIKGAAHFFSRGSRSLKVVTPYVNAAVEGTEFEVRVTDDEAKITLLEGRVLLENEQGEVNLAKGQVGVARAGDAPTSTVTVSARDAVKWALYYPRVLQASLEDAAAVSDAQHLVYQAEEKLVLGQVDVAEKNIDEALAMDTAFGPGLSLKSVIAVVNNRKDEALALAQQAVSVAPEAASSHIALSYARQAGFDLDGALAALDSAVQAEPENAIAWARLSEVRLALGEMSSALAAAREAASLQPDLSHTRTVLGYAYLSQIKIESAREAFETAILLDSAAPLPRLGLGLVFIREGELEEGRRLLEVAAGLDPGNSIFRSYLGKAYFEEKRDTFSADQLDIAKELDPMDPTPWFYDAIRKQSINRPVEALKDIQKSIELNDNRGVYRSSLHLDEDLAVRGTGLARIYNDLGFQQLALLEGWKSVNRDPSNYAAHRFLADSYATTSRHEIARSSEMLQAQLLQPINISPVSPQLAQGDLGIYRGSGPAESGYNEYMPLFERNKLGMQVSCVYGNGTMGDEVIQSGVWGDFSYSLGRYHYETDGVRENNDQDTEIYNAFVQMRPWRQLSLMAEYQSSGREYGDLSLRFDPDDYDMYRRDTNVKSLRVGFHYAHASFSDTLGTFVSKKRNTDAVDAISSNGIYVDNDGYLFEFQQQYKTNYLSIIGGFGYLDSKREDIFHFSPIPPMGSDSITENSNLYLYSYFSFPNKVDWTIGGSIDHFESIFGDDTEFNPKLGVTWHISSSTLLRAIVLHTLNRALISNQTIEPVLVAGFSQYFNDLESTAAERYGLAIDHEFSTNLHTGLEYTLRYLDVPYNTMTMDTATSEWEEKLGRAYLLLAPFNRLSTSIEYLWERFDRDIIFTGDEMIHTLETQKVSLNANYFHPNGLSIKVSARYVDQSGRFAKFDPTSPSCWAVECGNSSFFAADLSANYRLPKRYGIISLRVLNLFDKSFKYTEIDAATPEFYPERLFLVNMTLSF